MWPNSCLICCWFRVMRLTTYSLFFVCVCDGSSIMSQGGAHIVSSCCTHWFWWESQDNEMRWHNVLIGILCVAFVLEMLELNQGNTTVGIPNGESWETCLQQYTVIREIQVHSDPQHTLTVSCAGQRGLTGPHMEQACCLRMQLCPFHVQIVQGPSILSVASTWNCRWVVTFCAMYCELKKHHSQGNE